MYNLTNFNNSISQEDLQIKGYDELLKQAKKIHDKYINQDVDFSTESQAKHDKAALNKLEKSLNKHRLEQARQYLDKVDDFKSSVDQLRAPIQEASQHLKEQIDDCEAQLRDARKQKVQETVHKMSAGHGIDDISIQSSWLTKSATKSSGEPTFKTLKQISKAIEFESAKQREREADMEKIKAKASQLSTSSDGWIASYLSSSDENALANVLGSMERKHDEAIKQREAKKQATQVVKGKVVNTTTGEFEKLGKADVHIEGKQSDIDRLKQYAKRLGIEWEELR